MTKITPTRRAARMLLTWPFTIFFALSLPIGLVFLGPDDCRKVFQWVLAGAFTEEA